MTHRLGQKIIYNVLKVKNENKWSEGAASSRQEMVTFWLEPYLQRSLGPGPLDRFGPVNVDSRPGQRHRARMLQEATVGATGRRSQSKQDPRGFFHLQTADE